MKNIKDELQNIILGDEQARSGSAIGKTQTFLRRHAEASRSSKEQQHFKDEEAAALIVFAKTANLLYDHTILSANFISEGAEQKVYRLDDTYVIKTNPSIFYESWLDYFNSLLIHNYFFPSTSYTFLGFQLINDELNAVVKQEFVVSNESTNLEIVRGFLEYNGFDHKRNNDYSNPEIGLILEDLHDENVLSYNGVLYFIDTVFYLTSVFYK